MQLPPDPEPKRILITRLRFIGDVVLTTPVIKALKAYYPEADIYYLAEQGPSDILRNHPDLKGVIVLARDRMDQLSPIAKLWSHIQFFLDLRRYRFDLVIDLFCNPRSALLTFITGARIRVGYDVRGRGIVYNVKIKRQSSLRVIDAYLDAIRTLELPVDDDRTTLSFTNLELQKSRHWFEERALNHHRPVICINPGASWPAKTWGAPQFARLGDRLIETCQASILLVYGPNQVENVQAVTSRMKHEVTVVNILPLKELAAIIHGSDLFISNDCGPMHIAAAVGTRTIGIFGPSRPDIWFPYAEEAGHFALSPELENCCGKNVCTQASPCIDTISVDTVFQAAQQALQLASNP